MFYTKNISMKKTISFFCLFFFCLSIFGQKVQNKNVLDEAISYFNNAQECRSKKDYINAAKYYKLAADANLSPAQYELAKLYMRGEGVQINFKEAFRLFYLAATNESMPWPGAYTNLGLLYYEGVGIERNLEESIKWYRKGAEEGDSEAMYCLGLSYQAGEGVPQSDVEAAKWFQLATDKGHENAANNLGYMYAIGKGVNKDLDKAGMLYLQAAKRGSVNAQYVIGLWYLDGLFNFPKNENEALFWFKKAASQGHVKAQIKVAELEN